MGLFSFLKNAGAKVFSSLKKEEIVQQKEVILTKTQQLEKVVNKLGIPIDNLSIDLGEQVMVTGKTDTNSDREKIILALGNVKGISSVADNIVVANPEPEAVFYTVMKGDTLSIIAKKQYADGRKYRRIFEANKPMLKHPDKIYPGQVLRIPQV